MRKKRSGFSLIELLIGVVVLGILGALMLSSGGSAQNKARVTAAMTGFENYSTAFNTAMMTHPGIATDRWDAWKSDGGVSYTTKDAMSRIVTYMNQNLSEELQLVWSDEKHCYASKGTDPWGGNYVLLEHPVVLDESGVPIGLGFEPQELSPAMRFSIWCTGPDAEIATPSGTYSTVRDYSVGCAYSCVAGNVTNILHGASDGALPFVGATITIK